MTRYLPLAGVLLIIVVLGWTLLLTGREAEDSGFTDNPVDDPQIGRALPAMALLEAPWPVEHYDPASVEGPYILNVWASWCPPCIVEHPKLTALAESGIPIYAINYKDDAQDAQLFLDRLGDPFQAIAFDPEGRAAFEIGVTGPPETFIIDGQGVIRARFRGAVTDVIWRNRLEPVWLEAVAAAASPDAAAEAEDEAPA